MKQISVLNGNGGLIENNSSLKNLTTSPNIENRVLAGLDIIKAISNNPELITQTKQDLSLRINRLEAPDGIQRVIELYSLMRNTISGTNILDKYNLADIFDLNNPNILFGLMLGNSKSKLNNTARRKILDQYFENITEDDLSKILINLEKIDKQGIILKPFIMELVTFIFRNIQDNIVIKVKNEKSLASQELDLIFNKEDFNYGESMSTTGDMGFDLDGFESLIESYENGGFDAFNNTIYHEEPSDSINKLSLEGEDGFQFAEISDIFENVEEGSPFHTVLEYLKINYREIYLEVIKNLNNFDGLVSGKSSRLLHERINILLCEKPKDIEAKVIGNIPGEILTEDTVNIINKRLTQITEGDYKKPYEDLDDDDLFFNEGSL